MKTASLFFAAATFTAVVAQGPIEVRSTGPCSPNVVSNSDSVTITVTCRDPAVGKKLSEILSEILKGNEGQADIRARLDIVLDFLGAESQTSTEIQAHACEKLSAANHGFLTDLSRMIAAASDGWLPQTQQKFFSRRSVDLICQQLNADAEAPTFPKRSWRNFFGERTERYKTELSTILSEYASHLDASTVRAISEVERSTLLAFPPQLIRVHRIDQEKGWQRPPLLCHGLEDLFEDSFHKLAVLQTEVEHGEQRHRLRESENWRAFPFPQGDNRVGTARFGPDALSRWIDEHPHPAGRPDADAPE